MPTEIICNEAFYMSGMDMEDLRERLGITISALDSWYFDDDLCKNKLTEHFHAANMQALGLEDFNCGSISAGALLIYLYETQKNSLAHLTHIQVYTTGAYMLLDSSTRRNLELCETLREKQKRGSLLWVLDKTKTAMGARALQKIYRTATGRQERDSEATGCGRRIKGKCNFQRGTSGIFRSGL